MQGNMWTLCVGETNMNNEEVDKLIRENAKLKLELKTVYQKLYKLWMDCSIPMVRYRIEEIAGGIQNVS